MYCSGGAAANMATVPSNGPPPAANAVAESGCINTCPRCSCCGCTLREAAARHEQRVAANERLERANIEWKQVTSIHITLTIIFFLISKVNVAIRAYSTSLLNMDKNM